MGERQFAGDAHEFILVEDSVDQGGRLLENGVVPIANFTAHGRVFSLFFNYAIFAE